MPRQRGYGDIAPHPPVATSACPSGRADSAWMSEATRGIESVVTLTLEPRGDATLVTLRHSNLPDDAMGRQHEDGWGYVLGAIAERFSPGHAAAAAR